MEEQTIQQMGSTMVKASPYKNHFAFAIIFVTFLLVVAAYFKDYYFCKQEPESNDTVEDLRLH